MKRKKRTILITAVTLMTFGLFIALYFVKQNQDVRRRAQEIMPTKSPLYVSLDKPSVIPGESVTVTIYDNDSKQLLYSGYVFVRSQTCVEGKDCKTYTGQYVNDQGKPVYFSNGTATIDIPADSPVQTTRMRFTTTYPSKKLDWSNEITLTVNSEL